MNRDGRIIMQSPSGERISFEIVLCFDFEGRSYCLLGRNAGEGQDAEFLPVRYEDDNEDGLFSVIMDSDEMARVSEHVQTLMTNQDFRTSKLYEMITDETGKDSAYQIENLGEGMAVAKVSMGGWWKPMFLVNHNTKCAYVFLYDDETSAVLTEDDIDWDSLKDLPQKAQECARRLSFHFPSFIRKFRNGVAMVSWQLNPDGYYYCDEDGFGMTDDVEIEIYGFIDTQANVLTKFRQVENDGELAAMRREAEQIVSKKNQ